MREAINNIFRSGSKILAFLINIETTLYAYLHSDVNIMMYGLTISAGLMGFKTGMAAITDIKSSSGIDSQPLIKPENGVD